MNHISQSLNGCSRLRNYFARLYASLLLALLLGGMHSAHSHAVEPAPADLDVLLRLLGQGGVLNNERLTVNNIGATSQISQSWIDGVKKLAGSRTPEVSEAVRRLKPAMDLLSEAIAAEKKAEATRNGRKSSMSEMNLVGTQIELMHGPDEFQLDEMVRKRLITRDEADERIKLRAQLKGELTRRFGEDLLSNYVARIELERKTTHSRTRAEVLRNAVVQEVLRPAMQARAGAEQNQPPLEVKFGELSKASNGRKQGYVTVRSRSSTELTRVSLLVEIQTNEGNRVACIYLPKLPPLGSAHFDPITLSYEALTGNPHLGIKKVGISKLRYSVWCQQFHAIDLEPKTVTPEELVNEVRLQTVSPGSVYVSRGGTKPTMNHAEFLKAKQAGEKIEAEPNRRFQITFKTLKPVKQGYDVELELVDHQPGDKKSVVTQRYRGTFQLPPVKMSERGGYVLHSTEAFGFGEVVPEEKKTIVLKLSSGKQAMELHLMDKFWDSDEPEWYTRSGPAHPRRFVPDGMIPAADSPEGIARSRIQSAAIAKSQGKFDEALRTYQEIVADYPGTAYEVLAKREISNMDSDKKSYAEGQQKLAQMRSAQEAFDKKRAEEAKANEIARAEQLKKEAPINAELEAAKKLNETGKYEAALKAYQKFVVDHPEPGYVNQGLMNQFLIARKLSEVGKYSEAQKAFEKIVADHPDSPSASLAKGDLSRLAEMKAKYPRGTSPTGRAQLENHPSLASEAASSRNPPRTNPNGTGRRGPPAVSSTNSGTKLTREQLQAQARAQAEKDKLALNVLTLAKQALARKDFKLARGYLQQAINFSPDTASGKQAKKLLDQLDKNQ